MLAHIVVRSWWRDLGFIFSFFVVVVSLTNIAYTIFGFRLTEFFAITFDNFHLFLHFVLNVLVFSWLTYLLQWLWFSLTWLGSFILPFVKPWYPQITVPAWISDVMLLSLALHRAYDSAYALVPWEVRDMHYKATTPEMEHEIEVAQGILNWPHKITHWMTTAIWKLVSQRDGVLTKGLERIGVPATTAEGALKPLAAAVFLWGFIRLIGYSINVGMAGHLRHIPIMVMRDKLMKIFLLSASAAIVVVGVFLYVNGLLLDFKDPSKL